MFGLLGAVVFLLVVFCFVVVWLSTKEEFVALFTQKFGKKYTSLIGWVYDLIADFLLHVHNNFMTLVWLACSMSFGILGVMLLFDFTLMGLACLLLSIFFIRPVIHRMRHG